MTLLNGIIESTSFPSACITWVGVKALSVASHTNVPPSLMWRVSIVVPGTAMVRYCSGATGSEAAMASRKSLLTFAICAMASAFCRAKASLAAMLNETV